MYPNLDPTAQSVLLAGDWHGNTQWATWVVDKSQEILQTPRPLIIQLGDFGIWDSDAGRQYLNSLNWHLEEADAELLFLDGNHENHPLLNEMVSKRGNPDGTSQIRKNIRYMPRGFRFSLGDPELNRTFMALGGAVSVDKVFRTEGRDWWPGEVLSDAEVELAKDGGHVWAMLAHDAPKSAYLPLPPWPKGWDIADFAKAEAHRDVMQDVVNSVRPELYIHGHYHLRFRQEVNGMKIVSIDADGVNGNVAVLDLENGVVH